MAPASKKESNNKISETFSPDEDLVTTITTITIISTITVGAHLT